MKYHPQYPFSSYTYISALAALLQMTKKCVKFRILAYCPGMNMEILNFNSWVERRLGGGEVGKDTEK